MAIKKTLQIGNKVIRARARMVKRVNSPSVKRIIKDLTDSMRQDNLVGMAAPQIGKSLRIFVTEIRKTTYRKNIAKEDALRVFINPRVIEKSKKQVSGYEGCGSVAEARIFGLVERSSIVRVVATDAKGNNFKLSASGLLARVIQHEIDHLDGKIFLDRVTDPRKLLDREAYVKLKK